MTYLKVVAIEAALEKRYCLASELINFGDLQNGKVGEDVLVGVLRLVVGPVDAIDFAEVMAVNFISDFARKLEKGTARSDGAHDD